MDARAKIEAILTEVDQAGYQRGWNDAFATMAKLAKNPGAIIGGAMPMATTVRVGNGDATPFTTAVEPSRGRIVQIVRDLVKASPGLRGNAIVDAVLKGNPGRDRKVIDRTTRTALLRLSKRAKDGIENRDGHWYPREGA